MSEQFPLRRLRIQNPEGESSVLPLAGVWVINLGAGRSLILKRFASDGCRDEWGACPVGERLQSWMTSNGLDEVRAKTLRELAEIVRAAAARDPLPPRCEDPGADEIIAVLSERA